jgi:hypothetical protein
MVFNYLHIPVYMQLDSFIACIIALGHSRKVDMQAGMQTSDLKNPPG